MPNDAQRLSDLELEAYLDGQLDPWQRVRVEAMLAEDPQAAAQVMQDLRLQHELQLAFATGLPARNAPPMAQRLARGLRRDAVLRRTLRLLPLASVALAGGMLWAGIWPLSIPSLSASAHPPAFVAAGLAAREASTLRFTMRSMPETAAIDPEELRALTGILLPGYDPDWQMLDAQVFPSPHGPGVEIVFQTPDLGRVTHFALRPGGFAVTEPRLRREGNQSVVWFQIGETAHVLIADRGEAEHLAEIAATFSAGLH